MFLKNAMPSTHIQHPLQVNPTEESPKDFSVEIGKCGNLLLTRHYNALHFAKHQ